MSDAFDLDGATAVVTGASRGIGRAIALGIAERGANVVIVSRKADACDAVVDEITAAGGQAMAHPMNLGDADAIDALLDATTARFGGLDLLVNNAATALDAPVGQISAGVFDKVMAVNVRGPVLLSQAALPLLEAGGRGSIVNVLSVGLFGGAEHQPIYVAAKSALLSFTRSFARYCGPLGVRVNALAPGPVDTQMTRNTGEEGMARMASATRLGRIAAPEEMVGPALLLLSGAGAFVTGQVLVADGGMTDARG